MSAVWSVTQGQVGYNPSKREVRYQREVEVKRRKQEKVAEMEQKARTKGQVEQNMLPQVNGNLSWWRSLKEH
jgi:uncharacterized protein YaiL (DUF2058 family)